MTLGTRGLQRLAPFVLGALLAAHAEAQRPTPHGEPPRSPAPEEATPGPVPRDDPGTAFEFALSGDGLWFSYRSGLHREHGFTSLGLFASEDDDFALQWRLMRYGEPSTEAPLGLGVGLGVFGAAVDESSSELLAVTLTGAIDYALDEAFALAYPLRIGLELSYAPDVATFFDGTRVLDVVARLEADLSSWATAFVGYRHLELDLDDEDDAELDKAFEIGLRLGF